MLIDQSPLDVELSDPDVSVEFSEVLKYLEVECSTWMSKILSIKFLLI